MCVQGDFVMRYGWNHRRQLDTPGAVTSSDLAALGHFPQKGRHACCDRPYLQQIKRIALHAMCVQGAFVMLCG